MKTLSLGRYTWLIRPCITRDSKVSSLVPHFAPHAPRSLDTAELAPSCISQHVSTCSVTTKHVSCSMFYLSGTEVVQMKRKNTSPQTTPRFESEVNNNNNSSSSSSNNDNEMSMYAATASTCPDEPVHCGPVPPTPTRHNITYSASGMAQSGINKYSIDTK